MSTVALRTEEVYEVLCEVLQKNEIEYEKTEGLFVVCSVSGQDGDIRMTFCTDVSKMLITLYSPMVTHIPEESLTDASLAVCMLNHRLQDGAFCLDLSRGMLYFRMTYSYYNSEPNEDIFSYMLSHTAEVVENYRKKIIGLCMPSYKSGKLKVESGIF